MAAEGFNEMEKAGFIRDLPELYIFWKRTCRYVMVAKWLHLVSFLGGLCFVCFGNLALERFEYGFSMACFVYLYISFSGLVLIFFSQRDAFCRFQNYKTAKDLFYENRFKKRIARLFCGSKCQREAVMVAAKDLEMADSLGAYYHDLGYRWYHLIPDQVIKHPGIILTPLYWRKTLFVPTYQSKYFLW